MLLRMTSETVARSEIQGGWEGRLAKDGDGVVVKGDDTGEDVVFMHIAPSEIVASRDIGELLIALRKDGKSLDLYAPEGLSHFLHDSIVPLPRTIFRDVYALTIGDRARIRPTARELSVEFSTEFPYFARLSREDQEPNQAAFLELLGDSVERRLRRYSSGVLFMSAGKDSTAIALALAERGRKDVACVTYALKGGIEQNYARGFCEKLGLAFSEVTLESQAATARDTLERFFTETPLPSGDPAQIPTAFLTRAAASPGGAVIVGSGNDTSFGSLPYPKDRSIVPFCLGRTGMVDPLKRLLPPGSHWNYLLRDPVEICWPGVLVRHCDTSKFLEASVNTSRVWRTYRREHRGMDIIDFRSLLRGRNFEVGTEKRKIELAAGAFGVGAIFPYLDAGVIGFYFNLPEEQRFDRKTWTTKRFVRDLLRARLGYDDRKIGKWGFPFDGAEFVRRMQGMIREEIYGCRLFRREGLAFLERSIERVDADRYAWHHIVGLFQFAGWYNHSRYVR